MKTINNIQNHTCAVCAAKSVTNKQRGISSPQDKQDYWKIIDFFYPSYNPFASEFSAEDITTDVENLLLQMSGNFATCCKRILPIEYLSILIAISDAISVRNPAQVVYGMWSLFGQGIPGTLTYEACRNTQAAYNRSALHMAFMGI